MWFICLAKTIWRTFTSSWFLEGVYVSGHDFVEKDGPLGTYLECEVCGATG